MSIKNLRITLPVIFTLFIFSACKNNDTVFDPNINPNGTPNGETSEIYKFIPPSSQRNGDPNAGYDYLVYGDYLTSGVPYDLYLTFAGASSNLLNRTGDNSNIDYAYTAVTAPNGTKIVTSNCLTCHAQKINGELVIGLGNAVEDYTQSQLTDLSMVDQTLQLIYGPNSPEMEAFQGYSRGLHAVAPYVKTKVRGVSPADKIAVTLFSHINKHDMTWLGDPQLPLSEEVVPTDVPAWWLLKKKNAMFYSGVGRGDFARIMLAANSMTVTDSTKLREIDNNFDDVLAFINTLEAPVYPEAIDLTKHSRGEVLFNQKCATCHGSYGDQESYPNLLVNVDEVGTDPLLVSSNFSKAYIVDWYNTSWFSKGTNGAYMKPENGYIAPPLDGIWATAPYFHNGSVPTLEDVLHSPNRPKKWKRSFGTSMSEYDTEKVGWKYSVESISGSTIVYDTTLPGYGNQGHIYGDDLTEAERADLLEYLKSL